MCGIEFFLRCRQCNRHRAAVADEPAPALLRRGPDRAGVYDVPLPNSSIQARMIATVLHLRGETCCVQPLVNYDGGSPYASAFDSSKEGETKDALIFNGEIFGGADVRAAESDTVIFLKKLRLCTSGDAGKDPASLARALFELKGPWAFVYWTKRYPNKIFFGRDPIGRRSLLMHLPPPTTAIEESCDDGSKELHSCFALASVSVPLPSNDGTGRSSGSSPVSSSSSASAISTDAVDGALEAESRESSSAVNFDALYPYKELPPRGLYVLTVDDDEASVAAVKPSLSGRRETIWTSSDGSFLGRADSGQGVGSTPSANTSATARASSTLTLFPWPEEGSSSGGKLARVSPYWDLSSSPSSAAGSRKLSFLSDELWAEISLELLRHLSHAVKVRVSGISRVDRRSGACAAGSHSYVLFTDDKFAGGVAEDPSVSKTLQALESSGVLKSLQDLPPSHAEAVASLPPSLASSASSTSPTSFTSSPSSSRRSSRVAILFSGGIDSMVLAALAAFHVPSDESIDLINVCFSPKRDSPDRLAALVGLRELRALHPSPGRFRFIAVDETYAAAWGGQLHLASLMHPALSHMDFNIGSALWAAARGIGYEVVEEEAGTEVAVGRGERSGLSYASSSAQCANSASSASLPSTSSSSSSVLHTKHHAVAQLLSKESIAEAIAASCEDTGVDQQTSFLHGPPPPPSLLLDRISHFLHVKDETDGSSNSSSNGNNSSSSSSSSSSAGESLAHADVLVHESAPAGTPKTSIDWAAEKKSTTTEAGQRHPPQKQKLCVNTVPSSTAVADGGPWPLEACRNARNRKCTNRMCHDCCTLVVRQAGALSASTVVRSCGAHFNSVEAVLEGSTSVQTEEKSHSASSPPSHPLTATAVFVPSSSSSSAAAAAAASGIPEGKETRSVSIPLSKQQISRAPRTLVRSPAPVLLVGFGADEHMAGYARHRSAFNNGGWARLEAELRLDVERLWLRNLGRDDRVCSDHGRELRLPYLDESFVGFLAALPLPAIADLRQPFGLGDKRILRTAAAALGLGASAGLVKRAIHFGSRIAKQSNLHAFGSNSSGRGDVPFLFRTTPEAAEGAAE